jgi:uncharacterized coiled-coil protein SlyX
MIKNYHGLFSKEFRVKLYVIIITLLAVASLFLLVIFKENRIDDLEKKNHLSQATIDQLSKKLSEIEQTFQAVPKSHGSKINNIDYLISYLKNDLKQRQDLIPYEGVLGGTMGFYDENQIRILNHRWVYAHFEDGHIGGEILLKYNISEDGNIKWEVIDSF